MSRWLMSLISSLCQHWPRDRAARSAGWTYCTALWNLADSMSPGPWARPALLHVDCVVSRSHRGCQTIPFRKRHIQHPGKWCTSQSCLWDPWELSYHWGEMFCAIWYQVFLSRNIIWTTKGDHQLHNDQKITKQPEKIPNSLQTTLFWHNFWTGAPVRRV